MFKAVYMYILNKIIKITQQISIKMSVKKKVCILLLLW